MGLRWTAICWGVVLAAALSGVAGVAGGCSRTPFGSDEPTSSTYRPRSPYERYGLLRGDVRPLKELDDAGLEKPALRQRLRPLDQP